MIRVLSSAVGLLLAVPASGEPVCELEPSELLFPTIEAGERDTLDLRLTNIGDEFLVGVLVESCDVYELLGESLDFSLAAGESDTFEVVFAPLVAGVYPCTLQTGVESCSEVPVVGTAILPPSCSVEPDTLDFGMMYVGDQDTLDFVIQNTGGGQLGGAITVTCEPFELKELDPLYLLEGGESDTFAVVFRPLDPGEFACTLSTGAELCGDVVLLGSADFHPECAVFPDSLEFGEVILEEWRDLDFTVENVGGDTLRGAVSLDCPAFSLLESDGLYELTAGSADTFTVRFAPLEEGAVVCTVGFGTDCAPIAMTADGIRPAECSVDVSAIEFDVIIVGESADRSFTVTNVGDAPLSGEIGIPCDDFSIVGASSYVLAAGEFQSFLLRFTPAGDGDQLCNVDLGHETCSALEARGTGLLLPECSLSTDLLSFETIPVGTKSDRTFTIENSGGGTLEGTVVVDCAQFSLVGSGRYSLGASQEKAFKVRYEPVEAGEHSCTISAGSASGCEDLLATGAAVLDPDCSVVATSLDLGEVLVGGMAETSILVTNVGGGVLLGELEMDCPEFRFPGETVYELSGGESDTFLVVFEPTAAGPVSCEIETGNDDCNDVVLSAVAIPLPACEVSVSVLEFGAITIGQFGEASFSIENIGGGLLEGVVSEGCGDFWVLDEVRSYSLTSGEIESFTIRFVPTIEGRQFCTLELGTSQCEGIVVAGLGLTEPEPACEVSADVLDFGAVEIGADYEQQFEITNVGEAALLGNLSLDCESFSLVGLSGYELEPGESQEFTVRFQPLVAGEATCQIDSGSPLCQAIELKGVGVSNLACRILPARLEFGEVAIGELRELVFEIENIGQDRLDGAITILEACDGFFTIGPTGYSLPPGESQSFVVRMEPTTPGPKSCVIETGVSTCLDLPVAGTAIRAPECEVSPGLLDFGRVTVGQEVDRTLTISNPGGGRLLGEIVPDCSDVVVVDDPRIDLGGGEETKRRIRFRPSAVGAIACELDLGADLCRVTMAVGTGVAPPEPICDLSETEIDFGGVEIGLGAERELILSNLGDAPLTGRLSSRCSEFQVIGAPEFDIRPSESQTFTLRFVPRDAGEFDCQLTIGSVCGAVRLVGAGRPETEAVCEVGPAFLDFGEVAIGEAEVRSFTITNQGGQRLVGELPLDCPGWRFLGDAAFDLGRGEQATFELEFSPETGGIQSCEVSTGHPGCPDVELVALGASSPGAVCRLDSPVVDLGDVRIGEVREDRFSISNDGSGVLYGEFALDCAEITTLNPAAFLIAEDESVEVLFSFLPRSIGSFECELRSSDPGCTVLIRADVLPESGPVCEVTPSSLDFGRVFPGTTAIRTLSVANRGGGELVGRLVPLCNSLRVRGPDGFALRRGAEATFEIEFDPGAGSVASGSVDCTIEVGSCDEIATTAFVFTKSREVTGTGGLASFSLGLSPDLTDPLEALAPLGNPGQDYRLFRWNPRTGDYLEAGIDEVSLDAFAGLWLDAEPDREAVVVGEPVLDSVVSIPLGGSEELARGWTHFANPFQFQVDVERLRVEGSDQRSVPLFSNENDLTERSLWFWNGEQYERATLLEPEQAYWIRSLRESGSTLIVDPSAPVFTGDTIEPNWTLFVTAAQGESRSSTLRVGAANLPSDLPTEDPSPIDFQAPPTPPYPTLELYLPRAEIPGSEMSRRYLSAFGPPSETYVFDFEVTGFRSGLPIDLDFRSESLPGNAVLRVTEWDRRRTRVVSIPGIDSIDPVQSPTRFRLVVSFGDPDTVPPESELPAIVRLEPYATPNPFRTSTELHFFLETPGNLEISIYDTHGRLVRRLEQSGFPAGLATLQWDGRDPSGRDVQSGVYLARFRAGDTERTLRFIRMK